MFELRFKYILMSLDDQLVDACRSGNLEKVKYLINQGANLHINNDVALRLASTNGHIKVVKYLIDQGADLHADDNFSLICASRMGHIEVVKYLVDKGANIHAGDDFALLWASEYGKINVVKYLIDQGAIINQKMIDDSKNKTIKEFLQQKYEEQLAEKEWKETGHVKAAR